MLPKVDIGRGRALPNPLIPSVIAAIVLVAAGAALASSQHRTHKVAAASSTTTTLPGNTTPPESATTVTTPTTAALGSRSATTVTTPTTVSAGTTSLPLVVCPTTFGTSPPAAVAQPSTVRLSVPASMAAQLAVYSDNQATMRLVAPRGWHCQAAYGADGSGGVVVYPTGVTPPSGGAGAGWFLDPVSTVQAVAGQETSACSVCTTSQACPLFSAAAQQFQAAFGRPCPSMKPAQETVHQQSADVVTFVDPPGIAGDAVPSGGMNPANGVMTYYPSNPSGSWLATCTLPSAEQQLCTASLNAFLASYQNN